MACSFETHANVGAGNDDTLRGEPFCWVGEGGEELGFDEGRHFGEEVGEMVGKSTNCRIWHCLLTISTDTTNYRGVRLMLRTSGRTVTSSP